MTTERTVQEHKLFQGQSYTAARGVTLASGSTASVAIENPSGSGKNIVIDVQEIRADSASRGTYYRSPDISSATAGSAANDLIGDSQTTVANITYDGTYSNAVATTDFPMAESGANEAGFAERPPLAIKPGHSVAIEVTADASNCDVLFLFTFYETERGV